MSLPYFTPSQAYLKIVDDLRSGALVKGSPEYEIAVNAAAEEYIHRRRARAMDAFDHLSPYERAMYRGGGDPDYTDTVQPTRARNRARNLIPFLTR